MFFLYIYRANLSTDYFTNRQDRYFLIEDCKDLADFYDGLINQVSDFSLQLDGNDTAALKPEWNIHPSDGNFNAFVSQAKNHVMSFYNKYQEENSSRLASLYKQCESESRNVSSNLKVEDTWIFPLIQMGAIGISNDKDATCRVFGGVPQGSHIKLATGYFNLTSEYIDRIIKSPSASYDILMAHPKVSRLKIK